MAQPGWSYCGIDTNRAGSAEVENRLRVESEARIATLQQQAEEIETRRAAAEKSAQDAMTVVSNYEERINLLLDASNRTEAARVQTEDLAFALREDLVRAKAAQSVLAGRLKAEGSVERPTMRDIVRRYKRAAVETIDWLTIRRLKHRPKPAISQVLVISHMYPRPANEIGGIFVHEQVKALREQGVDVRVVSGEPFWVHGWSIVRLIKGLREYRRAPFNTVEHEGVPVTYFPWFVGSWVPHWAQAWTYSHGLSRIWREWAKDSSFGIVHAHTSNLDGTAARKAAARTGGRFVLTEHMGPFDVLANHPIKKLKTRAAVRAADRVFAVSSALRETMINKLGFAAQRVEVLGNGVDLDVFKPALDVRRSSATNVLWVGHHVSVKRIDRLLPAFAKAQLQNPALRLSLLGGGELLDRVKAQAASLGLLDKVKFLPPADRAGVAAEIRAHDYVVISSETETFGLVALEAMACGKPVLSTACGGPQDIIVEDYLGLIVENSEEGLTAGLIEMAKRSEMFDPARIRSHAEYTGSWTQVARSLTDVYAAALDQG
ncbi:MAG: glycosyltransferase family 4 protein [Burkholderiales bacterium]|nr:MAG: glycosyltransferase family 4 protein [Burkholderiales bacterium]